MAENVAQNPRPNKLVLKGRVYYVDKAWTENKPGITFKDNETEQIKTAHKTVLSQASPFFNAWFKEQWEPDKPSVEYPLPGDIDWEVFTTIISILHGEEVEFEEEVLPQLFRAADYLQLDTLKVAILVSLTEEWEVKNSEVVGAMLTAAVSQSDGRVHGGWLASVSMRYLVRNIHTVVNTPTADISALPYDSAKEIAQSEEIAGPEIALYHFLRIWCETKTNDVTIQQMEDLFSHIRYSTIPYVDLIKIAGCIPNNYKHLWSAISTCPNISRITELDEVQFIARRYQQPVLLLNSSKQNRWTKSIPRTNESSHCFYSVVSGSDTSSSSIVASWPLVYFRPDTRCSSFEVSCTIVNFSRSLQKDCSYYIYPRTFGGQHSNFLSSGGVTIQATATGVQIKQFGSCCRQVVFDQPRPWLLTIRFEKTWGIPLTLETM